MYRVRENQYLTCGIAIVSLSSRNLSQWNHASFLKTTAFSKAFDYLEKRGCEANVTSNEKVCRFVFFAIARGGLAIPALLTQLINHIVEKTLDITPHPFGPFVEFDPRTQSQEGNEGFRRWFIDTETLATIHALSACTKLKRLDEKSLFRLVKRQFSYIFEFSEIKSFKQLCKAGALFTGEHYRINLPAYLVDFMCKKTSTSISNGCWNTLWNASNRIEKRAQPIIVAAELSRNRLTDTPTPKLSDKKFLSKLRDAIKHIDSAGRKIAIKHTLCELEELGTRTKSLAQKILLAYILERLRSNTLRRSSSNTYLSHIGAHWLQCTQSVEILSLDECEMTELYKKISEPFKKDNSFANKIIVLKQFFTFGSERFGIALPVFDTVQGTHISNVRNYVISESNFTRFINELSACSHHQTHIGQGLVLTAILMARCGLRPGEVLKLRIRDVEPSNEHHIITRQNRFGDNKSYSALRKIPLAILLTPSEYELFESYLRRRRLDVNGKLSLLLFPSCPDSNLPYSLSDFYKQFSERLSEVCGDNVHTYHLRHKAVSTLQIVLMSKTLLHLTPYAPEQIEKIKHYFNVGVGRDTLFQIMAFAGHSCPSTTLKSYLHFTDVILYESLIKNSTAKHRAYWEGLSALSKHIITHRCTDSTPSRTEIMQLLLESLCSKGQVKASAYQNVEQPADLSPPRRAPTYVECMHALKLFDKGKTVQEISHQLDFSMLLIEKWFERATQAAELKTSKGKSRLLPLSETINKMLTPVAPSSNAEIERADEIIKSARILYLSKQQELIWFIRQVINNALNSHSYLVFSDVNEFQRFMQLALEMTSPKEWEIELSLPKDFSGVKTLWHKNYPDVELTLTNKKVNSNRFQSGRAHLYFLYPGQLKTENIGHYSRYSSNVIKYACHILAITIPGVLED
ncbi:MAG: site-specific integrase [Alteromonadaceae bacterium]|nr:site-specific integrase [Alteromonadaceae bacterium]